MPEKEIIIEIALERLRDFPGSPFSVTMDEPMKDLIESIRVYGILNPLIVRPMPNGCYQIISGHRRKFAAVKLMYRHQQERVGRAGVFRCARTDGIFVSTDRGS